MAITTKELVTGIILQDPKEFADFTQQQQASFLNLLNTLVVDLKLAARILLLQLDNSTLSSTIIMNPNLFVLASLYYGNPEQWTQIAGASNLVYPINSGQVSLIVPNAIS
jgi:hypothetical protein